MITNKLKEGQREWQKSPPSSFRATEGFVEIFRLSHSKREKECRLGAQNKLEVVRLIHMSYIGITYICREMGEVHPFPSICRVTVWPFEVTPFRPTKPERG